MRVMNVCQQLGAKLLAPTVAVLTDNTEINFVYDPDGLKPFASEYRRKLRIRVARGFQVDVLPIERILASKRAAGRPKDLAVIPLLRNVIRTRGLCARPPSL
jgi:hypothetical protein